MVRVGPLDCQPTMYQVHIGPLETSHLAGTSPALGPHLKHRRKGRIDLMSCREDLSQLGAGKGINSICAGCATPFHIGHRIGRDELVAGRALKDQPEGHETRA